jgi:amidase
MATSVYTGLFDLTGNPVVVLSLGCTKEGPPIGVQVVGKRRADMALLDRCARTIEDGLFRRQTGHYR